jgi:hypothetical protein
MKLPTTKATDIQLMDYIRESRKVIDLALPPGAVVPRHTERGHFYQVPSSGVYPSVTGKLGHVKDESIQNFAMNTALQYVSDNMHTVIKDGKIDMMGAIDMLADAAKAPTGLLHAAGDIGTAIHDRREEYFQAWIDSDKLERPVIRDFLHDGDDSRLVSCILGFDKFLTENTYIPIRCEVMVYSDEHKVAGMLDDIGLMMYKGKWVLTLMDLKTSNQMKAHYWLQVAMYNMMFSELTGLIPDRNIILKVNKDYPDYKVEELQGIDKLVEGAKSVLKTAETMEFIKGARKDIGKTVIKI